VIGLAGSTYFVVALALGSSSCLRPHGSHARRRPPMRDACSFATLVYLPLLLVAMAADSPVSPW